jgi:tyrosine-protein kinase Etk/Wzc
MDLYEKSQNNQNGQPGSLETIDLSALAQVLLARKKIIAMVMLIAFVCASIFVVLRLPVYQTSALIQVNNQQGSGASPFSALSSMGGGMGMGLGSQAMQSDIEMTLINSDYFLRSVVHQLGLDISVQPKYFPLIGAYSAHHYDGEAPAPAKLGLSSYAWGGEKIKVALFNPPFDDRMAQYELIVQDAGHYQLFSPDGDLILTGRVGEVELSHDGNVSILVTELSARSGTTFYIVKHYETDTLKSMQESLHTMELGPSSSDSMAHTGIIQLSISSSNPVMAKRVLNALLRLVVNQSSKQQALKDQQLLNFIQNQLPITQRNLSIAENALNAYQAKSGIISLGSQSKILLAQIASIDSQITMNELNEATLLQTYTPKDPIIQNINIKKQSLNIQKLKLQSELSALPMKDQKVVDLMRAARVQNTVYTLLLNQYQQTLLAKAAVTSEVTVLSSAQIPDQPSSNYAFLVLMASLLGGFIMGSLIVLAMHFLRDGISDPYWAEKELGIRTLAIIPFSKVQAKAKKAFDKKELSALPILAQSDPDDVCIESIRSLRTNLLLSMKEHKTNVVAVGGIAPQTGKSFVSVNLAVILSESGKRVLLIDADMRRGYLNQYFNLSHSPGLSEALENVYPLEKIIRRTPVENLDFMSTGIFPRNPSELLLGDRFGDIIQLVSAQYDVVVIDAPPILAVNDASLIAQKAGLNYIVIPGGQLKAQEIESAVRRFYNDGVKINGALFNFAKKMHQQTSSYGQSYGRYAQYTKRDQ